MAAKSTVIPTNCRNPDIFLLISEMIKVSTCLEYYLYIDNFGLAFDGGGIYEYGFNQPGNKGLK